MSIASRIESMTTHLQNDYDALESVVGTITEDKNIENIAPILDNLWEELPHTTETGTNITINNTKKGKMKVNLLGNTSQTGTPTPSSPIPVNVVSGDNTIVSTGKNLLDTSNKTNNNWNIYGIPNNLQPNTKYTFSIQGTTSFSYGLFTTSGVGSTTTITRLANYQSAGNSVTFTTPADMSNELGLLLGGNSSGAGNENIDIIKPQIELGETKTPYEPYTSTSYPIHLGDKELCKIGDYQDRFIRNSGKNLFNPTYQVEHQYLAGGEETGVANNGYSLSNGVITSDKNVNNVGRRMLNKLSLSAGTYTISGKVKFNNASRYYMFNSVRNMGTLTDIKPAFEINVGSATGTFNFSFTLSQDVENVSISLQPMTANDGTLELSELQLEKSSSATSYEPYGTNEWYLEKKIGKVVLDGSETWYRWTANTFYITKLTEIRNALSNYYTYNLTATGGGQLSNGEFFIHDSLNNYVVIFKNTGINDSIDDFKTWLSTHNTTVYYVLATPTYTQITGTLKDELESAWRANSYKDTTNISQVNNDLPFNLDITALEG